MEKSLTSIVIPAHNAQETINETIDSCQNQTYPNCEIIVVDDGSTDGTGDLLRERTDIRYLWQTNQGAGAARNHGIQVARGEYIQFCDADDQLLPSKIARCIDVFQQHPEVALVYTDYNQVEADGRTVIPTEHPMLLSGQVFCELLAGERGNFIGTLTVIAQRAALLKIGGFNESRSVAPAEDWELWLRLAARYPFVYVHEVLALYRQSPNALHKNAVRMAAARLTVIQLARQNPKRAECMDDVAYDRLEAGRYHVLAMAYWQQDQRREARQAFRSAIRLEASPMRRLAVWLSYLFPPRFIEIIGQFCSKIP